jgi:hypothetical protein
MKVGNGGGGGVVTSGAALDTVVTSVTALVTASSGTALATSVMVS